MFAVLEVCVWFQELCSELERKLRQSGRSQKRGKHEAVCQRPGGAARCARWALRGAAVIRWPFPDWSITASEITPFRIKLEPSGEKVFGVIFPLSCPSLTRPYIHPFLSEDGPQPESRLSVNLSVLSYPPLKMDGFAGSLGECYHWLKTHCGFFLATINSNAAAGWI